MVAFELRNPFSPSLLLWDPLLSCFYPCPVSKPFGPVEVKFKMRAIAFISSGVFKGVRNVMPFSVHE